MKIASAVKSCRDRLDWTESGLALRAGITTARVEEIERGRMPTVEELLALAQALGVTCDVLLGTKLPATVTVGGTTVTIVVSVPGYAANDRLVVEKATACVEAVRSALTGAAPKTVEARVPARAYSDLQDQVKAAEARATRLQGEADREKTAMSHMTKALSTAREEIARLQAELSRLQSEGDGPPR